MVQFKLLTRESYFLPGVDFYLRLISQNLVELLEIALKDAKPVEAARNILRDFVVSQNLAGPSDLDVDQTYNHSKAAFGVCNAIANDLKRLVQVLFHHLSLIFMYSN